MDHKKALRKNKLPVFYGYKSPFNKQSIVGGFISTQLKHIICNCQNGSFPSTNRGASNHRQPGEKNFPPPNTTAPDGWLCGCCGVEFGWCWTCSFGEEFPRVSANVSYISTIHVGIHIPVPSGAFGNVIFPDFLASKNPSLDIGTQWAPRLAAFEIQNAQNPEI